LKRMAALAAGAVSVLLLLISFNPQSQPTNDVGANIRSEKIIANLAKNKKAHELRDSFSKQEMVLLKSSRIKNKTKLGKFTAQDGKPIKGSEVALLGAGSGFYEIEITEINIRTEGGIEVFARAWKDGQQLGFGKDGSVDIERFIIPDPPILVPTTGIADYERIYFNEITATTTTSKFAEDPEEALKEILAHNIKIVGKEGTKITSGKVGNTTTTVYSGSGDGGLGRKTGGGGTNPADWSIEQTATAAQQVDYTSAFLGANFGIGWYWQNTGNRYWLERVIVHFDTSSIPDTDTIDSATISGYPQSAGEITNTDNTGNDYIYWCEASPASTASLTANDYDNICDSVGAPTERTSTIDLSALNGTAYNDFTVNAGGLSLISKTGVDSWGGRIGDDITAEPSGTRSSNDWNRVLFESSEETGTTKDPKMVIVHSAPAGDIQYHTGGMIMFD
jgi:hypothetical protein